MEAENRVIERPKFHMGILVAGVVILVALAVVSGLLLGNEALIFWKWEVLLLLLGIGFYPLTHLFLNKFQDGGFFFARPVGIAASGFLTWFLCYLGVPFISSVCVVITLLLVIINWSVYISLSISRFRDKTEPGETLAQRIIRDLFGNDGEQKISINLIFVEEVIFAFVFLMWFYLVGCKPEALTTEKMMDFGFMASMMRSDSIPATDMWYSEGIFNYYYGGQYYCVFLTKLFFEDIKTAYNTTRAMVGGMSFAMAFSLVHVLLFRTVAKRGDHFDNTVRVLGGLLGGISLSLAGNVHFILFAKLIPMVQEMLRIEVNSYWFSDSTRYIGYVPDVADKTIHEYPDYSFLLGDMHAHVINIIFVLPFLAILIGWVLNRAGTFGNKRDEEKYNIWKVIFRPEILFLSLLIGIFKFTNYWDFPIYFGLAGLVILFTNIRVCRKGLDVLLVTICQAVLALVISTLSVFFFTHDFDSIFKGFGLCMNHSRFYQLVVLWGLPVFTCIMTCIAIFTDFVKKEQKKSFGYMAFRGILPLETFIVTASIWATILIIVPELVYVVDIYGSGYSRANTMFKFTYQAFMIFAVLMSYGIVRMILYWKRRPSFRTLGIVLLVILIWTADYFPVATKLWMGNVLTKEAYKGQDATAFLETNMPEEAEAIRYLDEHIEGTHVVLTVDGNSYSENDMLSAMTGLPTILGWYNHELLWRDDSEDLNKKKMDISSIYTNTDTDFVKSLLDHYNVEYVYIGSMEKAAYPNLNLDGLKSLGTVEFTSSEGNVIVIRVDR